MDWTQIIVAIAGSGTVIGFLTFLLTSSEKKTKAQMANMKTQYDNLQDQFDRLQERYDKAVEKYDAKVAEVEELHRKLDTANTKMSIAEMKRCDCITCTNRIPPLGETWKMTVVDPTQDDDNC